MKKLSNKHSFLMSHHTSRHRVYKIGTDPNLSQLARGAVSTGWSRHYVGLKGEDLTPVLENRSRDGKNSIGATDLIRYKSFKAHNAALRVNPWSMWVKLYSRVYQRKFAEAMCDPQCKQQYLIWKDENPTEILRYEWPIPGLNGIPDIPGGPWNAENWNGKQDIEGMSIDAKRNTICPLPPSSFDGPIIEDHVMLERDLHYVQEKRRRGQGRRVIPNNELPLPPQPQAVNAVQAVIPLTQSEIDQVATDVNMATNAIDDVDQLIRDTYDEGPADEGFGDGVAAEDFMDVLDEVNRETENIETTVPTAPIPQFAFTAPLAPAQFSFASSTQAKPTEEFTFTTPGAPLALIPEDSTAEEFTFTTPGDPLALKSIIPELPIAKKPRIEPVQEMVNLPDLPEIVDLLDDDPPAVTFEQGLFSDVEDEEKIEQEVQRRPANQTLSTNGITKEEIDLLFRNNGLSEEFYPDQARLFYEMLKIYNYDLSNLPVSDFPHLYYFRILSLQTKRLFFYPERPEKVQRNYGRNVKGILTSLSKAYTSSGNFSAQFKNCILWSNPEENELRWMNIVLLYWKYSEEEFENPHLPIRSIQILYNHPTLKNFYLQITNSDRYQFEKIDYEEAPNDLTVPINFREMFAERLGARISFNVYEMIIESVLKYAKKGTRIKSSFQTVINNLHILGKTNKDKESFSSFFDIYVVEEIKKNFKKSGVREILTEMMDIDNVPDMEIKEASFIGIQKVTKSEMKKRAGMYIEGREYYNILVKITFL